MLKSTWDKQPVRFLVVGSLNSLCDLSILNFLVFWSRLSPIPANVAAVSISVIISYHLNRRVVFRVLRSPGWKKFVQFIALTGLGIVVVQSSVFYLILRHLTNGSEAIGYTKELISGLPPHRAVLIVNVAKILAILTAASWNYFFYKHTIFNVQALRLAPDTVPED